MSLDVSFRNFFHHTTAKKEMSLKKPNSGRVQLYIKAPELKWSLNCRSSVELGMGGSAVDFGAEVTTVKA